MTLKNTNHQTFVDNPNYLEAQKNSAVNQYDLDYCLVLTACCILDEEEETLIRKVVAPIFPRFGALINHFNFVEGDYHVEIGISIPPFVAVFDVIEAIKEETCAIMVSYNSTKYNNFFWFIDYFVCAETAATPEILADYKTMRRIIDPKRLNDCESFRVLPFISQTGGD